MLDKTQSSGDPSTFLKEFQTTTQVLMGEMRLLGEIYAKQMQVMMAQLQSQGQLQETAMSQVRDLMEQSKALLEQNETRNQEYSTSIQAVTELMTTIVETTTRLETIAQAQINILNEQQE